MIYKCPISKCDNQDETPPGTERPSLPCCVRHSGGAVWMVPVEPRTNHIPNIELAQWVIEYSSPNADGPIVKRAWQIIAAELGPASKPSDLLGVEKP